MRMDDNKTQDSKKTVVAFVAGLLIGGLLVWIFSASPEAAAPERVFDEDDKNATFVGDRNNDSNERKEESGGVATTVKESSGDHFTFTVTNQPAGSVVSLGQAQYPTVEGWIVVHEDVDGELGSALGAARYDTGVGLTPIEVELLRGTESGKTYRVVYYTESGDKMFDLKVDTPMAKDGGGLIEATFVAE